MRQRLQSVLTLLFACLMLGASTQSAVCELACGLGGGVQCHGAATASTDGTMAGMHCSGMSSPHSSASTAANLRFESSDAGLCRHPLPLATMSSIPTSESVAAVHWIFVEPVPIQPLVAAYRFVAHSKASPLRPVGDPLLVTLRV
ncbi:hypothetical protein HDF16_004319 [Granulicella aggregans]|uniref:Uncharacterized protein n=1 Tax=Granulicella aggregans TaxID=474949 RepID=A0A7W7ZH26_9BACT|nr:hypothetical protein [Granulicella aggregans]MBB5059593.1 hypothetical protein [Granulicella aggregans]